MATPGSTTVRRQRLSSFELLGSFLLTSSCKLIGQVLSLAAKEHDAGPKDRRWLDGPRLPGCLSATMQFESTELQPLWSPAKMLTRKRCCPECGGRCSDLYRRSAHTLFLRQLVERDSKRRGRG